jgi:DNA-3-methyladenine glycosylase II
MNNNSNIKILNQESLIDGVRFLAAKDSDFADIVDTIGPPPLWDRPSGFATLVYIILEQQVSLSSARAAYNRLIQAVSPLTPENFLEIPQTQLKAIGFSRQKSGYCRSLACEIIGNRLDLDKTAEMNDEEVISYLTSFKGIGSWTAQIYLLEVLLRQDIWPTGDLALARAIQQVKKWDYLPTPELVEELGHMWRPWRSVAARLFWHHYLSA